MGGLTREKGTGTEKEKWQIKWAMEDKVMQNASLSHGYSTREAWGMNDGCA